MVLVAEVLVMVEEMEDCGSYVMLMVGNDACACLNTTLLCHSTSFTQTKQGIVCTCCTIIKYDSVLLHALQPAKDRDPAGIWQLCIGQY